MCGGAAFYSAESTSFLNSFFDTWIIFLHVPPEWQELRKAVSTTAGRGNEAILRVWAGQPGPRIKGDNKNLKGQS